MSVLASVLAAALLGPTSMGLAPAAPGPAMAAPDSVSHADPLVLVIVSHPDDPEPFRAALEEGLRGSSFQVVTRSEEEREAGIHPQADLLVLATVSEVGTGGPGPRETLAINAVWVESETIVHAHRQIGTAEEPLDPARESAAFAAELREAIGPGAGRTP